MATDKNCEHCNNRYPLHDLECPIAVASMASSTQTAVTDEQIANAIRKVDALAMDHGLAENKLPEAVAIIRALLSQTGDAKDDRRDQNARRWRWTYVESPSWTYAVCKWDGEDWLPIKTEDDIRELDTAIAAQKEQT